MFVKEKRQNTNVKNRILQNWDFDMYKLQTFKKILRLTKNMLIQNKQNEIGLTF